MEGIRAVAPRPLPTSAPTLVPVLLSVGILALGTGCGGAPSSAPGEVAIDTLAGGVIQVTSSMEGRWGEEEGWVLSEELRIGTASGVGPESFGQIAALAVDDSGRIFVLDNQARELRVFGPAGEHLRTIGRQGGGPGEFGNPVGLAIHPGEGTIWVVDPGNGRYTVFGPDGELVETHPRLIGYFAWPFPGGFTQDGEFFDVVPQGLVRLTPPAEPADTVPVPEDDTPRVRIARADGVMMMSMVPPFGPRLHWRFDPGGYLWTAVSDRLHFSQTPLWNASSPSGDRDASLDRGDQGPPGEPVRIVRRPHHPTPASRWEADSIREELDANIARSGVGSDIQIEGDMSVPAQKPAFQTFLVDDGGHLWVEPSRPADDPRRRFLNFAPDGGYLGPVEVNRGLAASQVLPVFRSDDLYAVVADDLGVDYVVRFRVARD
jgi:hypothetical protein